MNLALLAKRQASHVTLAWTFLLLSLLSFSAIPARCGEIVAAAGFSGPQTTIRYSMWGGQLELDNAKKICAEFVALHPEIRIDVSVYPWGDYWQKVQTQTASGLAPDVLAMTSTNLGIWSDRGALLPLDKLVAQSGIKMTDYRKVAVDNCTWNGKLAGFPLEIPTLALVYNADKLEQAGIPESEWPSPEKAMPWDKFLALCRQLTLRQKDGTYVQYGMAASSTDINTSLANSLYGAHIYDHLIDPSTINVDGNQSFIKGWEDVYKNEYADRVIMPPLAYSAASNGQSSPSGALESDYAMCTAGPWDVRDLESSHVHFRFGVMPKGPFAYQGVGTNCAGIFSGSRHPNEAWKFVQFLGSLAPERILGSSLKGIPSLTAASDSMLKNQYGAPDCQAFYNGLPASEPGVIVKDNTLTNPANSWIQTLEQGIEQEYDTRYRVLTTSGQPATDAQYATFVAGMQTYIDQAVTASMKDYQLQMDESFALVKPVTYGPGTTVVGPAIFLGLIVAGLIAYFVFARKTNREGKVQAGKNQKLGLLFISPWLVGFVFFGVGPLLASIALSFTNWNMIKPPGWIGMGNYSSLPGDPYFIIGLKRTFLYALVSIPISVMGGLITAGLLTARIKGSDIFKAIIYFPAMFTGAEAAVLWLNIFNKDHGVLNNILSSLHFATFDWLDEAHIFWSVIFMSSFWIGGAMIICYAGMKQIPVALYEAADIEGANFMQQFFRITVPLLSPVILFLVIVGTIGAFQIFTPALFFSGGANMIGQPGDSLRYYSVLIYDQAFNSLHMGKACCLALILFAVIFVVTMGQMAISRRFVYSDLD